MAVYGKINNPEGKNQYTSNGSAGRSPVQIQGGYSKEYLDQMRSEAASAQSKRVSARTASTNDAWNEFGAVKHVATGLSALAGWAAASAVKASGLGLKDTSYSDLAKTSGSMAVELLANSKQREAAMKSQNYEKFLKADAKATEANQRYVRALTKF